METAILKIETTCNTSDKVLLQNLQATKDRGLEPVPFFPQPNETPLFICGSGPSLLKYFRDGIKLFPNAHIMALNGAYKALLAEGVVPHYYTQLDARPVNTNFVESANPETTFLLASQCAPEMFEALEDQAVLVYHLNTPTTKKVFPDEKLYLGGGATVGSTAMALAASLGYRTLCLFGYDSSYEADKSHIVPQPQNAEQKTLEVWVKDRSYISTPAMAKQVEEFRPWVAALEKVFPNIDIRLFGKGLLYDFILEGQKVEVTRENEAAKYSEMYKYDDYGMPEHRAQGILDLLSQVEDCDTLLDVGTGRGETLDIADGLGFKVQGTETVDALLSDRVTKALLPTLPFPDKSFDVVTNFEVIEHLLPADVTPALREMERVAKDRIIISAATRSDTRGGVELHPSYRSADEWLATFKAAWGPLADVRLVGNLSSCGLSPVYEYRLRTP